MNITNVRTNALIKADIRWWISDRNTLAIDAGDVRADDVEYVLSGNFLLDNTCTQISAVVCTDNVDAKASIFSTCTDCRNWDTRTDRFGYWYHLDPNKLLRGLSSGWRNYLKPMKKWERFNNESIFLVMSCKMMLAHSFTIFL